MTTKSTTSKQSDNLQGDYIFVRADSLCLLFPLNEVDSTSYFGAEHSLPNNTPTHNISPDDEKKVTHLAISATMELLPKITSKRFILTRFKNTDFHWCWDEMIVLTDISRPTYPIPVNFLQPHAPTKSIVMIDKKPVFVCSSASFISYVLRDRSVKA